MPYTSYPGGRTEVPSLAHVRRAHVNSPCRHMHTSPSPIPHTFITCVSACKHTHGHTRVQAHKRVRFCVTHVAGFVCPQSVPGSSSITINYMTGDLTGNLALETFSLGSPPITVGNQSFITTLEVSEDFFNSPCDGLMVRCALPPTLSLICIGLRCCLLHYFLLPLTPS